MRSENIEIKVYQNLPIEADVEKEINLKKDEEKINLMFEIKNVSIFHLYLHISGVTEIILMIIAIISSIGAGCSNSIIAILIGDSVNSCALANILDIIKDYVPKYILDKLYAAVFDYIEPDLNEKIRTFLIVGAVMFFCNFI